MKTLKESRDLHPLFKQMGLTTYESRIWQALLEKGEADAQELTRYTEVPFGRVYDILNSLVAKGIVEVQDTRPKRFRPRRIKGVVDTLLGARKAKMDEEYRLLVEAVEEIKKRFATLGRTVQKEEVFVTVALGEEDTMNLVKEQIDSAEEEILIAVGQIEIPPKFSTFADAANRQLIEAAARGVSVKIILPHTLTALLESFSNIPREAEERLRVRAYRGPITHFKVIDHRYVVVEVVDPYEPEHPLATVQLLSKKLADHMTRLFERYWSDSYQHLSST